MARGKLDEYARKRTFDRTPEPAASVVERSGPLLFVVQMHAATRLHYDLRLECDGVLKSWAVPKGPSLDPSEKRLAMQTEDHPFDYASFEGIIPAKQYGAGEVIVWDCGVYSPDEGGLWFDDRSEAERQVREGLENGKLSFQLRGEKVKGSFALVRTKQSWLLLKHRDRFAGAGDVAAKSRSVLSGATVEELKTVPSVRMEATRLVPSGAIVRMPAKLEPMQAGIGEAPFNKPDWLWEPKLDGYRALAFVSAEGVKLRARRGIDLAPLFPRLVEELRRQDAGGLVLDGEIVCFDASGKASLNALQNRVQLKTEREIALADRDSPAVFVAFDLLHFAGVDLRDAPYRDRRRYLSQCLLPSPLVQLMHASEDGIALHEAAIANGFEGVVGKRLDGRYLSGKLSDAWLSIKARNLDPGLRRDDGHPGRDGRRPRDGGDPIAEILRQLDTPKAVLTLAVGAHRIKLTNLDRVYWPENKSLRQPPLAKRDLLRYLARISPYMLPHLADRPLTMIRMPDGIRGQRFFQKHWEQARPDFVESVTVFSGHKGEEHEYLLCNNLPTLLWLAQSGTLEFHVWHSRARPGPDAGTGSTDYATSLASLEGSILNYPDYVLFDIDPYIYSGKEAKGAEPELNTRAFEKGKEVAFRLRELLQTMALDAIVKTSGKTGLHVFVPIRRTLDFDAARHVSELVGAHLMGLHPKDITLEWSVPKRTGKIFMDYNMNVRGKTLNVAYSPRGEPGAPVSMPLTWEELARAHPLDFRMANAPERLAATGDRWADALEKKYDLETALRKAKR